MGGSPRVYSIPAGVAFADALAEGLMRRAGDDPLALAAITILLPTRRAVRALTDAFEAGLAIDATLAARAFSGTTTQQGIPRVRAASARAAP